jgi:hypothetical protein
MAVLVVSIFAILLLLSARAWAGPSRDDAATAAHRATNGRVLSIEKAEPVRRAAWRVKVVTPQGEVRVILIDAVSGHIETADRPGMTSPTVGWPKTDAAD